MNVIMEPDVFHPTPDEIRVLQTLAPGWEEVWKKIALGLLGYNGKGRLSDAVGWLRGWTSEEEKADFVAFVIYEFQKLVKKGTLIPKYDPANPKADVYDYICYPKRIKQLYNRYKREVKGFSHIRVPWEKDTEKRKTSEAHLGFHFETMAKRVSTNEKKFCSSLLNKKLTLQLPDNKNEKKFGTVYVDAGLQLYFQLDDSLKRVERLIGQVRSEVRKIHTEPSRAIEYEHQEAQERLDEQADRYSDEIYKINPDKPEEQKPRNVNPSAEHNARRKLLKTELERVLYPLEAMQMMRLLGLTRDNADKRHERYKEKLPELFCVQDKKVLGAKLDIPFEEGGGND